ncbi:CMGC protein kinase [Fusarium oxysporum NRRL 32931]|uniref:CMGC protein kinase n=1 Tax=Fusarium oxysporum NRRL 32931 TaxID=660029 RepID=W9HHI9_FUSOX|nr:CMGC protein kinase [Fusarium oxysporum NRRL 32931]
MATSGNNADCASVWGDFVGSDDEGDVEDASEPPERYDEGLYYPICIGEILIDRYRIEHKLGHGGFSTVWMAHDMFSDEDVALKILTPGRSGEREFAAQNMIASAVQDTSRLLLYRTTFLLPGASHTYHRVLVFPLLGPSLHTYASNMPTASRRSSAEQLLQAIKALHDGGVVHRVQRRLPHDADINSANVIYGLAPFKSGTTIATKYKYLGRPRKMPIPTYEPMWKDGQLVMPMVPHSSLIQETIALADFGLAIKSGTSVECKIQSPIIYCAPERIHNVDPSFASDMWSYMCIFAELYLGFPLFYNAGHSMAVNFMDESWYDQTRRPEPRLTLEAKVMHARDNISPAEQQLVLSILKRGLSYNPEHRFTAGQLLEDASFEELMAMYGL